jgi:hypothetical protein
LIFWPGVSVLGSRCGFSRTSLDESTPVFSAMPDSVSPDFTVYVFLVVFRFDDFLEVLWLVEVAVTDGAAAPLDELFSLPL